MAALLRTAEILSGEKPDARVTVLFSAQEETGGSGVTTAAYQIYPQEAIMVDVSFAKQPGVASVTAAAQAYCNLFRTIHETGSTLGYVDSMYSIKQLMNDMGLQDLTDTYLPLYQE